MKRLNSQQFNQSPRIGSRGSGGVTLDTTTAAGITEKTPSLAQSLQQKPSLNKRSHFQSMNSTNVNSGSESTHEVDKSAAICLPRLKKDDSLMHPSSPSKIQIDSVPKYNNKLVATKRKTSSSANSSTSAAEAKPKHLAPMMFDNNQIDIAAIFRKLWATHKGSVYSVLKTLFVLMVLIMLKRTLQRLIPPALLAKITGFLL